MKLLLFGNSGSGKSTYAQQLAAEHCTELIFMNPGLEQCLANNQRRPWEPHKYASKEAQDEMLANLQAWVTDYYTRDDAWSYKAHRRIFDGHAGAKRLRSG